MRIVSQTSDQLVISDNPMAMQAILALFAAACLAAAAAVAVQGTLWAGITFAIGGLAFAGLALAVGRKTRIEIDRRSGEVRLSETGLRGRGDMRLPMADLRGAALQSVRISRGAMPIKSHRPVLRFEKADNLPLRLAFHRRIGGDEAVVGRINKWLGVEATA